MSRLRRHKQGQEETEDGLWLFDEAKCVGGVLSLCMAVVVRS